MTLPTLPLPFPVSEVVPVLLHPAVVHFAVVLPLVILILELINLITKRRSLTITVYLLFVLLAGVYIAAYGTGVIDGKNGGLLVSDEGLSHLKEHKNLGIYLLYLSGLPILLKLLTLAIKKPWAKVIYLVSFVAIIALTLYQAKEGGELVYEYGLNVEAKVALDDTVEELQDEMDELKEQYEEQIAVLTAQCTENNDSAEVVATITNVENNISTSSQEPVVISENINQDINSSDSKSKSESNSSK